MFDSGSDLERMCRHCGSMDARRIGTCSVCDLSVCEKCGNVQFVHGERRVTHDACLAQQDEGFTMIKFVR